jgi:pyruvate dehydrogenase E2 component (dihydrolipoamide acetyltransferase)
MRAEVGGLQSQRVPLSNMRQTIARRLVEAKTTIPHYQVSMTFRMDELMDLRKTLNEQLAPMNVKLSVNDFIVRACALAMHEHPEVNASWDGDALAVHGDVNIGVAIDVGPEKGGGLVVATIRNTDQRSLRSISAESKALSEKARTRGLSVEDMSDSTFTVSNLGMFGVEHFTAIINPPNSAILAVGAAIQKPVVRDGELAVGWEMAATLSSDHRVIDGAMAAEYLRTLKRLIEHPAALMV